MYAIHTKICYGAISLATLVENLARILRKILSGSHHRILQKLFGSCAGSYKILHNPKQDPIGSYRILCRIIRNPVGSCEDFYDPKCILYIAGSLRESCKILTEGFNKEFLPGCLTEHPVHHLVRFSVEISVRSYTGCWINAIFLAEIFSGCYNLLLNGRETVRNK